MHQPCHILVMSIDLYSGVSDLLLLRFRAIGICVLLYLLLEILNGYSTSCGDVSSSFSGMFEIFWTSLICSCVVLRNLSFFRALGEYLTSCRDVSSLFN
uniref:Secreted protein n=1 Tax=Strongyloides venezuelensis TaxID=75913 RepID=A0A0K0F290_STRVS